MSTVILSTTVRLSASAAIINDAKPGILPDRRIFNAVYRNSDKLCDNGVKLL